MPSYILIDIDSGGFIRTEDYYEYIGYDDARKTNIVHKETINLDKQDGIKCYADLEMAKTYWSGPETDQAILMLDEQGAGSNILMAEEQSERLTQRLKTWSSCYGGWKVRIVK